MIALVNTCCIVSIQDIQVPLFLLSKIQSYTVPLSGKICCFVNLNIFGLGYSSILPSNNLRRYASKVFLLSLVNVGQMPQTMLNSNTH